MVDDALQKLYERIAKLSCDTPYVWALRISAEEFAALENALKARYAAGGVATLYPSEWAKRTIVYLAEWYKRSYDGASAQPAIALNSSDLAMLWENSALNQERNLFCFDDGERSWRYSLYVLGGLALHFEMGKANARFLKQLCRLYHGDEEADLEEFGEKGRAAAFRRSILEHGSLYEYLKTIFEGNYPFASADRTEPDSLINRFIARVKSANDEVLRDKFYLEWVVIAPTDTSMMRRFLRLRLKPEAVGCAQHQYLSFERVRLWGIRDPEQQKSLRVYVRFWNDEKRVMTSCSDGDAAITYYNTGCHATGFLAWGVQQFADVAEIPGEPFNAVEVVVAEEDGSDHAVQRFAVVEWLQLFRCEPYSEEWSSRARPNALQETALLCTQNCRVIDGDKSAGGTRRCFVNRMQQCSEQMIWHPIREWVKFIDERGSEHTLYNRCGFEQVNVVLHPEILRYSEQGTVTYLQYDDEGKDYVEVPLPLLFCRDELVIRHFPECMNVKSDCCGKITKPEKIEFKAGRHYIEWNDEQSPEQGIVKLRLTSRGKQEQLTVYYFPHQIARDCLRGRIRIGKHEYADDFCRDGSVQSPVRVFEEKDASGKLSLEVWRATSCKAVIRNDRTVRYIASGERFALPYIFKNDVVIQDFSPEGYRKYCCRDLKSIYALPEFRLDDNSALKALEESRFVSAVKLDSDAPQWLDVCLSVPLHDDTNNGFLQWNYFVDTPPESVAWQRNCPPNEIIFPDLREREWLDVFPCVLGEYDVWEYDEERINFLHCFEIAAAYGIYFFAMLPLREKNCDYVKELYIPLCKQKLGRLIKDDVVALQRFADEFGFDWKQKGVALPAIL